MTYFTSTYQDLAHAAPNWDTQLRNDMGFLETMLDQAAWAPSFGGGGGATLGNNGGSDGYAAKLGTQITYNGRFVFGSSAVSGNGTASGLNVLGLALNVTHSFGTGYFKPVTGTPRPLMLLPASASDFTIYLNNGASGLLPFSTLGNPAPSDQLVFVVHGVAA